MNTIVAQANAQLMAGEVILYPTDTVWGLGCDATNFEAVEKIYKIKQRAASKSLIVLVDSLAMLQAYVGEIPQTAIDILQQATRPTTIIYNNPKGFAKNTIAEDNTIAIRIVQHEFCQQLLQQFGKPIISTSANISGEPTPKSFDEISDVIKTSVHIVKGIAEVTDVQPSTILKIMEDGTIKVLRA